MKYDQIAEAYITLLIEGRIDDLKTQNPNLVNEIDSYVDQDPTPQKKFVPWLVSQHKKGNVRPDTPDLHQTLSGFETYKSRHGIKDHSSKTYQEVRDTIKPFLGTAATNKELKKQQIHEGIDQVYSSDDGKIQAFHVKTKEASQHIYGGGRHLGGLHTDWCVSARSGQCLFGKYGTMYTIHAKDDPKSPYAVHLDGDFGNDRITTRDNVPDEYELDSGLKKFPHLKSAVDVIKNKHPDILIDTIKNHSIDINPQILWKAAQHHSPDVAMAALNHPKADVATVRYAVKHRNPDVSMAALNHPKADFKTTWNAAKHRNPEIALAALQHSQTDNETTYNAAEHDDISVVTAALNHPMADAETTRIAVLHNDPDFAIKILNHPKADSHTIGEAAKHHNPKVVMAALNHLMADATATHAAAMNSNPQIAMAALNHPKANVITTYNAAENFNPDVVLAALNHPKADGGTWAKASQNIDPEVREMVNKLKRKR